MPYPYSNYSGYNPGYYNNNMYPYNAPMPDNLAQLRNQQQYQQPAPQPMQQPSNSLLIWVQGEEGAKAYIVPAGQTFPLWDSENQTIYLKSVDNSGMPSMRVLDYVERIQAPKNAPVSVSNSQEVEFITRQEFEDFKAEFAPKKVKGKTDKGEIENG